MGARKNDVEVKIEELKNQTTTYLAEIKELVEGLTISPNVNVISYFTSALNIAHDTEHESLCLGTYHIRNMGNQPLTNPYLCIMLPEDSPFSFSGQYVYENFTQKLRESASWERINDKMNKEEFWLRPLNKSTIEPNETISFPNFQLKWTHSASYAGSVTGITYCDELQEGIAAINSINLSGSSFTQEDEDE